MAQDDVGIRMVRFRSYRTLRAFSDAICHYSARYAHFSLPDNIPFYSDEWNQIDFTSRPRTLPPAVAQTIQKQLGVSHRSSASQSFDTGPITLVRRIRVYEGVKKS